MVIAYELQTFGCPFIQNRSEMTLNYTATPRPRIKTNCEGIDSAHTPLNIIPTIYLSFRVSTTMLRMVLSPSTAETTSLTSRLVSHGYEDESLFSEMLLSLCVVAASGP